VPGRDIRQVVAIAKEFKMNDLERREFGDYLEECKRRGDVGSKENGDFTYAEMRAKAREFQGDDR